MKLEIKNRFTGTVIVEGDFSSVAELIKDYFTKTQDLCGADLRGAKYAPYVESVPDLDNRILSAIEQGGALEMRDWHKCETTHCRAGLAVTLHPAGKTLESILGTPTAATLIYNAAYPTMKHPDFYCGNEEAMKDIKARAALTTQPQ